MQDTLTEVEFSQSDLIEGIGMAGIVPASDSDWDDVRALGMERDDTGISKHGDVVCPSD